MRVDVDLEVVVHGVLDVFMLAAMLLA